MLNFLKTEFIHRFDPDYAYLKQAVRTGLATLIALMIYRSEPFWTQGYWIVLAAAFLMQTRLGNTQWQQLFTLISAGICAALFAFLAGYFSHSVIWLALYLGITTFIAIYIGLLNLNAAITAFFINLFAIMSAGLITNPEGQKERLLMILLGTFIAACLCFLWPTRIKNRQQQAVKIYLLSLAALCDAPHRIPERRTRALRLLNNIRQYNDVIISEKAERLFCGAVALVNIQQHLKFSGSTADSIDIIFNASARCFRSMAYRTSPDFDLLRSKIIKLKTQISQQSQPLDSGVISFVHHAEILLQDLEK